ncbi:MAG: biotin-dependent carboxyltransferase family protein [Bacillota bacterium]|nr:biotin-dependent carboxyltransferase family protein [Bacillota bacterium]
MSLRIVQPGFFSTVQDLGRIGFQSNGVSVAGAIDTFAHRVANILVGNDENAATIEMTLKGGSYEFQEDTVFSICGADLTPELNGNPIGCWRPFIAEKGSLLSFWRRTSGFRTYLAVSGGFAVSQILGSSSTDIKAKLGGLDGRTLQKEDRLSFGPSSDLSKKIFASRQSSRKWRISPEVIKFYENKHCIHILQGREYNLFSSDSRSIFTSSDFTISNQADRMGYRLNGAEMKLDRPQEMISAAVTFGTIQVPSDGRPIILMADHQTIGGYPKIAQIVSVDLPILAQMMPGESLRFQSITLSEAQRLLLKREVLISVLKKQIEMMYR